MTRMHPPLNAVAVLAAALIVTACDDGTSLESLDDTLVLDAAILAADATLEEVTMWSQPLGFGDAPQPAPALTHGPGHPGGHETFSSEFSGTRSVTFYDADGQVQDAYDPVTTESIHLLRDIEGVVQRDSFRAEISRSRDMTVSGLSGEETQRTWNGFGTSDVARSGVLEDGTERSHTVDAEYEFDDVVVPIPGSDTRYPLSGSIYRSMIVTRTTPDGTRVREVEIVITFDGTSIATAVVNGEVMEIDLAARDGRNPLRRRR